MTTLELIKHLKTIEQEYGDMEIEIATKEVNLNLPASWVSFSIKLDHLLDEKEGNKLQIKII